jgi:glutathione S-transferase
MASHIALEESGLRYEPRAVNMADEAQRGELIKLNPKGKIPTITVDGRVLTENIAILTYVARMAPAAGLLPEDALERAQCLSMLSWYASTVHIAFRQSWRPERFADDPQAHKSIRENGRKTYWEAMQSLGSSWSTGPRPHSRGSGTGRHRRSRRRYQDR